MKVRPTNLFIFLYFFAAFLLFLYSFTQIDLGLTLTRMSFIADIQRSFQYVGYFNRPLSTFLFIGLVILLFAYYFFFLILAKRKKINERLFWILLLGVTLFLAFSYNAFSHDIFNYIFDAKILSFYHENPYTKRALDFPTDPMLGFMHWTHRTYPYGPIWLSITAPLSLLGFQHLLLTQILFKLLMAGSFVGSVYYIGEILRKYKPDDRIFGMVFFGFNPLVLIESLVSAHNDIVMMFFALVSIYFLIQKRLNFSLLFIVFSIGTKFATALLLPLYLVQWFFVKRGKAFSWDLFFHLAALCMFLAVIFASLRTNFQPWYLLYFLAFAPFLARRYYVLIPSVLLSLIGLFNYTPYLYLGHWNEPVPTILFTMNVGALAASILLLVVYFIYSEYLQKHA